MEKQQLKKIYEKVYKESVNSNPGRMKLSFEKQMIALKVSDEIPQNFEYIYSTEIEATITSDERVYGNLRELLVARGHLEQNQTILDLFNKDLLMLIMDGIHNLTNQFNPDAFIKCFGIDVDSIEEKSRANQLLRKDSFSYAYKNHDQKAMQYLLNIDYPDAINFVKANITKAETCDCVHMAILKSNNQVAKQLYISSFSKEITSLRLIEDLFLDFNYRERQAMQSSPHVIAAMCKYVLDNNLCTDDGFLKVLDSKVIKFITPENINFEYLYYNQGKDFFKDIDNLKLYLDTKPIKSPCSLTDFAKHGNEQVRDHILVLIENNILNDYSLNLTSLVDKENFEYLSQICNLIIDTKQHWNREVIRNLYFVTDVYSSTYFEEMFKFVTKYMENSQIAIINLLSAEYSDERCNIVGTSYFKGRIEDVIALLNSEQVLDKRYIDFYLKQYASEIKTASQVEWLMNYKPEYLSELVNYQLILDYEQQKKFEYIYAINYEKLTYNNKTSVLISGYLRNLERLSLHQKQQIIAHLSLETIIKYNYKLPNRFEKPIASASPNDVVFVESNQYQNYLELISNFTSNEKSLELSFKDVVKFDSLYATNIFEILMIELELITDLELQRLIKSSLNLKSENFKKVRIELFKHLSQQQQLEIIEFGLEAKKPQLVEHVLLILIEYSEHYPHFKEELAGLKQINRTIKSYIKSLEATQEVNQVINPYPDLMEMLEQVKTTKSTNNLYQKIKHKINSKNQYGIKSDSLFKFKDNQYLQLYKQVYEMIISIVEGMDEGFITDEKSTIPSQVRENKEVFTPISELISNCLIVPNFVNDYIAFKAGMKLDLLAATYSQEQIRALNRYIEIICYYLINNSKLILDDGIALLTLNRMSIELKDSKYIKSIQLHFAGIDIDYFNLDIGTYSFYDYLKQLKQLGLNSEIEKYIYYKLLRDVSEKRISPEQVVDFYSAQDEIVKYRHISSDDNRYMVDKQIEVNQLVHDAMVDSIITCAGKNSKSQYLKIFGMNNLTKMLKATKIDKGFNSSWTADYIASANIEGTTQDQFNEYIETIGLTEIEFIDLAIYNSNLLPYVASYLAKPMIESLVLFFIAHDSSYIMYQSLEERIARFTTISVSEIRAGRVCYDWYKNIESNVGKEFISNVRARLYNTRGAKVIDGLSGEIDKQTALQKILNKRNKDMLLVYSLVEPDEDREMDLLERAKQIRMFKQQSKQFGAQRRSTESNLSDACIKNLGDVFGLSESINLEIFRLEYQDNQKYFEGIAIDDYIVKLVISDNSLKLQIVNKEKTLKTIPAKIKSQVAEIKVVQKEMSTSYKVLSQSFEQLMITQSEIAIANILKYVENPLINQFITNLIFETIDNQFIIYYDNAFRNEQLEIVEIKGDKLRVAHITSIINNEKYFEWKQLILNNRIVQPFKQLFREAYFKQEDELEETKTYRYSNHAVTLKTAFAVLNSVGWSSSYDGMYKLFTSSSIRVELWGFNQWYYDDFNEENSFEEIHFYDLKTNDQMQIKDVDNVVFSEVMRDFDLAVSVAHVGEENKEIGLSTVAIRKEILDINQQLFKLSNLVIDGHKVRITGTLGNYVVNLKSGDSFKEGSGQLILFPVNVKRKKDVYLPYIDKNSKTQEIMSLIIMLSRDDKISNQKVLKEVMR